MRCDSYGFQKESRAEDQAYCCTKAERPALGRHQKVFIKAGALAQNSCAYQALEKGENKGVIMTEEKIITVNLSAFVKKRRSLRTSYATRILRETVARSTGAKNVKLGSFLNKTLWSRGAKKPPTSVRVKAIIDEGIAKVELLGHDYADFKPTTVAKREKMMDKLKAHLSPKEQQKEELEKKIEGKDDKEGNPVEPAAEEGKIPEEKITEDSKNRKD